jgi:hypothetical protein
MKTDKVLCCICLKSSKGSVCAGKHNYSLVIHSSLTLPKPSASKKEWREFVKNDLKFYWARNTVAYLYLLESIGMESKD